MPSELQDWHERLRLHFSSLCSERAKVSPGMPVFALEHGLAADEVTDLFRCIRCHIKSSVPSLQHVLAWTAYAAEFGYIYAGDEYWQTFEDNTPGWTRFGDRSFIRRCFATFSREYGGAEPTGAWASHFSIICWPITHAILPRDMQTYLAHVLYNVRHLLSQEILETPRRLGELIALHGWRTSSRFQQLLQEPLLIGQIAAALLLEEDTDSKALILPETLARISGDLAKEQRSRNWLHSARETARERIAFQRLGTRAPRAPGQRADGAAANEIGFAQAVNLEPRISLRQSGDDSWDAFVELPDLSGLGCRYPRFVELLATTRFCVAGSSGRRWPAARLLHSRQQVQLVRWPAPAEPIIQLENSAPELDFLLQSECAQRIDPLRVFAVASDGTAGEVGVESLRPNHRYVIACSDGRAIPTGPQFSAVRVACAGIWAVRLDMPPVSGHELTACLRQLGITCLRTTRVWPVGLTPSRWDGEGRAEWLSTDCPSIAICADHTVEGFRLVLEDETLDVAPPAPGAPVFVELPQLGVGTYHLRISELFGGICDPRKSEILAVSIRAPRPALSGLGSDCAFLVLMEPVQPTLEQLWQGELKLEVFGPPTRQVTFALELHSKREQRVILQKTLPAVELPLDAKRWREYFDRHFREKTDVQNAYDAAHACEVKVCARELGVFRFRVEREYTTLRWVVRRSREQYSLELADDRDATLPAEVRFLPYLTPDCPKPVAVDQLKRSMGQTARAGLYVAQAQGIRRCVIIPPPVRTLEDLRIAPSLREHRRNESEVTELVELAMLWRTARITGDIFSLRMQRSVAECLFRQALDLICGERWAQLERQFHSSRATDLANLACRTVNNRAERDLLSAIAHRISDVDREAIPDWVGVLAVLCQRHLHLPAPQFDSGGSVDNSLRTAAALALYLASYDDDSQVPPQVAVGGCIAFLLEAPGVVRAARFLRACRAGHAPTGGDQR